VIRFGLVGKRNYFTRDLSSSNPNAKNASTLFRQKASMSTRCLDVAADELHRDGNFHEPARLASEIHHAHGWVSPFRKVRFDNRDSSWATERTTIVQPTIRFSSDSGSNFRLSRIAGFDNRIIRLL
jgi:hypothetical protein